MNDLDTISKQVTVSINKAAEELQHLIKEKLEQTVPLDKCKVLVIRTALLNDNIKMVDLANATKGAFIDTRV